MNRWVVSAVNYYLSCGQGGQVASALSYRQPPGPASWMLAAMVMAAGLLGMVGGQSNSQDIAMCALSATLRTLPACNGTFPLTPVCSWPSVFCIGGSVLHLVALTLNVSATLPTEIGTPPTDDFLRTIPSSSKAVCRSAQEPQLSHATRHRREHSAAHRDRCVTDRMPRRSFISAGLLSRLTHLEFSGLGFPPDAIPLEIKNTPLLRFIVSYSPMYGSFPSALGGLSQLQYLQLTSSSFSGSVPAALGVCLAFSLAAELTNSQGT